MCEQLTSTVLRIREPFEIGVWNISSHGETWTGLNIQDGLRCDWREIEWKDGMALPDIRFRDEDTADLRQDVMNWFLNRWPDRLSYVKYCISLAHDIKFTEKQLPEGVQLPESIGGYADFQALTDAKGLAGLKSIGGYANFRSLTDAKGLAGLKSIGGNTYFDSLTDAKGLAGSTNIVCGH